MDREEMIKIISPVIHLARKNSAFIDFSLANGNSYHGWSMTVGPAYLFAPHMEMRNVALELNLKLVYTPRARRLAWLDLKASNVG